MKHALTIAALLALALLAAPQEAAATPEFAKQWASSCSSCHVGAPTALDEEGVAFRLAGYDQAIDPKNPRPKLFLSFLTDLVSFSSSDTEDDMAAPDAAQLFTLLRLDKKGIAKVFVIGELTDDDVDGLNLDFAHGHFQINPLEQRHKLGLRLGNVEPLTRMWNTDMRRVSESTLWGGVDTATGDLAAGGGGHHAHGSSSDRPGVLPASDWGGDLSSVIGRNLLVAGGIAGDVAYGGIFLKRGGRGFDNSTVARDFQYNELSAEEQTAFNQQQTKLAKKWERSAIFGLSAYVGGSSSDVFDGSFLPALETHADEHGDEHGDEGGHGDEHGDEGGDDHGDEGGDEHGDEGGHGDEHGDEGGHGDEPGHEEFLPARMRGSSRLVGEIKTRWDRYGFYLVGVYGENDYGVGDPEHWEEHGEFELARRDSQDFFAWALEGSARFDVDRSRTGRVALRYERLDPENRSAVSFERAIVNVTIPIRIMRPAIWPYVEADRNMVLNDWTVRGGVRLGY